MNDTDNQALMTVPGYESLADVLQRAYDQAAKGKGADRHAGARPFAEQPMQSISGLLGSPDGLLYQAMKKVQESKRLDRDAGIRELLGAINYLAGAVIFIEADTRPRPRPMIIDPAVLEGLDIGTLCAAGLTSVSVNPLNTIHPPVTINKQDPNR